MLKVNYALLNNKISLQAIDLFSVKVTKPWDANKIYVIQDQVIPPNSPEVSAEQHRIAAFAKEYNTPYFYGSTMAGHYLTKEIVKAGDVVVATDEDIFMIGAQGALGIVVDAATMAEVLAKGELEMSASNYFTIKLQGTLDAALDMRSVAITIAEIFQPQVNAKTILQFVDCTEGLKLEEKMLLCGWCQRMGARSVLFTENAPEDVVIDLAEIEKGYVLPAASTFGKDVIAVYIGGSQGGFLEDIKLTAELLKNKKLARKVRLSVAPASSEIYYMAATAGYLTTIMQAGGLILNQCAQPSEQARIGEGEVLVSNDIHNEPDYAGKGGEIVLTDTRTAVEMALKGYLGFEPETIPESVVEKVKEKVVAKEDNAEAPMTFTGRVWKFGDDIDTDIIMPTQHLSYASMDEIKSHIFEPLRPELAKLVQPGDIIVGGSNFGCGSSREQAAEILAYAGIKAIVAKSFARIFFRNSINNGMLLIECPELPDKVAEGDTIIVNINKCIEHKGKEYAIPYLSDNLYRLVRAGGLVKSTKKQNGVL